MEGLLAKRSSQFEKGSFKRFLYKGQKKERESGERVYGLAYIRAGEVVGFFRCSNWCQKDCGTAVLDLGSAQGAKSVLDKGSYNPAPLRV